MFGNDWNKFVSEYTFSKSNAEKKFMMKMKILNMILDMKRSGDYIQSYAVKFNRERFNENNSTDFAYINEILKYKVNNIFYSTYYYIFLIIFVYI